MRKSFITLGLIAAAAFTLTNCAKEIDNPVQTPESAGVPFEIVASTADTKTANDGMSTVWVAGDAVNVFYAEAGTATYVDNGSFSVAEDDVEAGRFTGSLAEELTAGKTYDWYALYPYNSKLKTPGEHTSGYTYIGYSTGLAQTGYNSMASLKGSVCPLYGIATNVAAGETPSIMMNHLSSVVAINVTNTTDEPLTVTTASMTAEEDLVGSYFIDVTTSPVTYTPSGANYVKKTAIVNVSDGTALAKGESAKLYVAIKPFTAAAGEKLILSVNGYEKELVLNEDLTFAAGKIKTVNFAYDQEYVEVEALSLPWFEDFSSKDLSKYVVKDGGTTTKLYESESDNLAGGQAPELLIAKNNGSFSANIATDGYEGVLTLMFKSNYPDRITVSSSTSGVEVSKIANTEYQLNVTGAVEVFDVLLTNTTSSNTRVDDVYLIKGVPQTQTLSFEHSTLSFYIGSEEAAAFTGQVLQGAKTKVTYSSSNESVAEVDAETGVVTLKDVEGSATITATAVATEEYKEATATYLIVLNAQSQGGQAKQYTFTITKDDFNSTSYAANNNEKTSTATAEDGSEMTVRWTSNQVMNQNSTMQWQKSKGYIYNSTDLGTIDNITITSESGTFTQYIGASVQPTTTDGEGGYFQIKVGSATGKVTSIEVKFTK